MWKVGSWASVVWFPGTAGSLAAGSVSQFSIPAKERVADFFFHQKVLVIEYCSLILCLYRHFVSLKAVYFFVLNISQAHCCLLKQRPGVQLSICHAVLTESKFVLTVIPPFWSKKNIMGEKDFLDSLNIPCVAMFWQSSVCKRHDSRRDPPA